MKKASGYIKIFRSLKEKSFWQEKPFSKGQAFIDLLLITNYKKGILQLKNGLTIEIQRGECGYSVLGLSDRWGWSRGKINRFLLSLQNENVIQLKIIQNHSIIRVLNYEFYQNMQQTEQQTSTRETKERKDSLLHKLSDEKNFKNLSFDWQKLINDWIAYKKKKKQSYNCEKSIQAFVERLTQLSKNDFLTAEKIVHQSMANNWSGIFEINNTLNKNSSNKNIDEKRTSEAYLRSPILDTKYESEYVNLNEMRKRATKNF